MMREFLREYWVQNSIGILLEDLSLCKIALCWGRRGENKLQPSLHCDSTGSVNKSPRPFYGLDLFWALG